MLLVDLASTLLLLLLLMLMSLLVVLMASMVLLMWWWWFFDELATDPERDPGTEEVSFPSCTTRSASEDKERFTSTCCCFGDDSWTQSNLVLGKAEVEVTLYCDDDDRMYFPSVSIVECFGCGVFLASKLS